MQIIRGVHNIKNRFANGCVVTIGNYDGVHLGHAQILEQVSLQARRLQLPAVVILFEPQPEEFFAKNQVVRLTSLREKIFFLGMFKIDYVLCLRFNTKLAELPASVFVEKILVQALQSRYLVIGDDFVFGHKLQGDYTYLQQCAAQSNFVVQQVASYKIKGVRVSSTLIRAALAQHNLKLAAEFLGRQYSVCGRVVVGDKLGRELGFPTANIYLPNRSFALAGVYAVRVYGVTQNPLRGVANFGIRPTVGGTKQLLEVHILDFAANIYGKKVWVEFIAKIRDEQKFDSLELLRRQINNDIDAVVRMSYPVVFSL